MQFGAVAGQLLSSSNPASRINKPRIHAPASM